MARPEITREVLDRFERIAIIDFQQYASHPTLLKAYAALMEAAEKLGGKAEANYSTVEISIPKNEKQLQLQLEQEQRTWDSRQEMYRVAVRASADDDPLRDWEKNYVIEWAKKEKLPNPFDVFAANDPELAKIREDLGLSNEQS